jgi:hypothetical protein
VARKIAWQISGLSVTKKSYTITALLVVVTIFLLVMSIQSVRLQTAYRHLQASYAATSINIRRVSALIDAIVIEQPGIHVSVDYTKVREFGDELTRPNRELAQCRDRMEESVGPDDAEQFAAVRERIVQFIDFRKELVRSAFEIGPAATRQWGDNEANRSLRSRLNTDLEEFERASNERAASLGDRGRYAAWYLFLLGLAAVSLAGVNVLVMRESVVGPLTDIAKATDLIGTARSTARFPMLPMATRSGGWRGQCSTSVTPCAATPNCSSSSLARPAARRRQGGARQIQPQLSGDEVTVAGRHQQRAAGHHHARHQGSGGCDQRSVQDLRPAADDQAGILARRDRRAQRQERAVHG